MRKGMTFAAITAMLAQGPVMAGPAQMPRWSGPKGQCYQPAPLPQLGPESWNQTPGNRPMPLAKAARTHMRESGPMPPPPALVLAPAASRADAGIGIDSPAMATSSEPGPGAVAEGIGRAKVMPGEDGGVPSSLPPPRYRPNPQAGLLTAGEHDDLLNPELYSAYLRGANLGQELPALPRFDTGRVLTVAVKDAAGRPVPFADVELACADGGRMHLATTADGAVSFFPELDRLGQKVSLRVANQPWREVTLAAGPGGQQVQFTLPGAASNVGKLDLMLVIDTTGSMGDEIRYLQAELGSIIGQVKQGHPGLDIRIGFVFYRDVGDDYVTNTVALTRDFSRAQAELAQRHAGGGGDYPEAMDQALIRAAGQDWRPDAVKTMLLVADAPPHDEKMAMAWRASEVLRHRRVQIVPVAASGVADRAEYVMRAMAAMTQSRYTFLTDDSGIGNPHAAPAIDCYLVTRLNDLLRRVIDSQISGHRIEPAAQDVIRTVGRYDHGRCIIPPGALQDR